MAFAVRFYRFTKKTRSTAIPSSSASYSQHNCINKGSLDLLHPEIVLKFAEGAEHDIANLVNTNYARIPAFERWYFVSSWRNEGQLWIASLDVDALASWRQTIGSNSIYVLRSSAEFNGNIPDTLYPVEDRRRVQNITLPRPWTIGGANWNGDAEGSGYFIAGIIGKSGTTYHALTPGQLNNLLEYMFSQAYYDAVLGTFGAIEYPEAKTVVNPMQYISSIKFVPGSVNASGTWGLRYIDLVVGMDIGPVSVGISTPQVSSFRLSTGTAPSANTICQYDIALTDAVRHPQSSARGAWLNFAPYTSYELYYPPFGLLQLDPADVSAADHLVIRLALDARTCIATLDVIAYSTNLDRRNLLRVEAPFGVDVPLSNILQPGTSAMQIVSGSLGGVLSAVGGAISGNVGAAIGGVASAVNGVGSALVSGRIPHLSTLGGAGNTASLAGDPALYITHWYVAPDDNAGRGRPLCDRRTISAIPGYIMGDADELAIGCTEEELTDIRGAVAGGMFYE